MPKTRRRRLAQLVYGNSERQRFTPTQMLDCISLAATVAGLEGLIYWASHDRDIDAAVRACARNNGLELYLWLPVLADAGYEPARDDLTEDAWGRRGQGIAGAWSGLGKGDEAFLFSCPNAVAPLAWAFRRLREELPNYDGVFIDRIRYPAPSNGLEAIATCFCPRCRELDRRNGEWRDGALEMAKCISRATRAEVANWDSFSGLLDDFGLREHRLNRMRTISRLVGKLEREAAGMGKKVGLNLYSPALAGLMGQDYKALGDIVDWIKPILYCRAKGPAGIAFELACIAKAMLAWGKKLEEPEVMDFLRRSFEFPTLPNSADELEQKGLDESAARKEYFAAARSAPCPVYPGFECIRHPDFDLDMTENGIKRYLHDFTDAPGLVMAWNILYTPESFLRLIGEDKG